MDVLALILQLIAMFALSIALYYVYLIHKYNKLSWNWTLIFVVVILLFIRRILGTLDVLFDLGNISTVLDVIDRPLLPLASSILLAIAFWGIKQNFDELYKK